ncbi:uncharacterized protein LOC143864015 [Tasmannia lanceolata]|uniref:uncharacterized protein LOC143864015 n=1 Tax=Tasmannia lanceolata TaxID=3420 RepID=UPI004062E76B
MTAPKVAKDVQRLTGRIAALSRFMSKSAERCLPFFRTLRSMKDFRWTEECQTAFDQLKLYIQELPLLSKPVLGEDLYLYLAVGPAAVSSMLVRQEGKAEQPIYYISRVLHDAETRYQEIEKFASSSYHHTHRPTSPEDIAEARNFRMSN